MTSRVILWNDTQFAGAQGSRVSHSSAGSANSACQKPYSLATRLSLLTGSLDLLKPRLVFTLSADDFTRPTAVKAGTQQLEPNKVIEVTALPFYSVKHEARVSDLASVFAPLASKEARHEESKVENVAQPLPKTREHRRAKFLILISCNSHACASAVKTPTQRAHSTTQSAAPRREHKNSATKAKKPVPPSDDDVPCEDADAADANEGPTRRISILSGVNTQAFLGFDRKESD
ncbi:hypothetical protein BC830DRAFT_1170074 [Chytriomyces sp. MP71]|nr:hypothetical protein BC830DRAFT_1170074 [Chytriomyces sp. MP71]